MIANIVITIILIIFFSSSAFCTIIGIKSYFKINYKKDEKMLLVVLFISASFSGYALIEFIKMIN